MQPLEKTMADFVRIVPVVHLQQTSRSTLTKLVDPVELLRVIFNIVGMWRQDATSN